MRNILLIAITFISTFSIAQAQQSPAAKPTGILGRYGDGSKFWLEHLGEKLPGLDESLDEKRAKQLRCEAVQRQLELDAKQKGISVPQLEREALVSFVNSRSFNTQKSTTRTDGWSDLPSDQKIMACRHLAKYKKEEKEAGMPPAGSATDKSNLKQYLPNGKLRPSETDLMSPGSGIFLTAPPAHSGQYDRTRPAGSAQ